MVTISAKDPKSKYLLSVCKIQERSKGKYATGMAIWLNTSDWDNFFLKLREGNKTKIGTDPSEYQMRSSFWKQKNGFRYKDPFAVILFLQISLDTV